MIFIITFSIIIAEQGIPLLVFLYYLLHCLKSARLDNPGLNRYMLQKDPATKFDNVVCSG